MIFTHKYRASKNRLDENCGFQKICVMKNQNFPGQTPHQSDSLTKGSISRLQGLNRKKERYDKNIQKVSSTKRIGKNEDPEMNKKLERSVQTKINLVVRKILENSHYQE